MKLLSWVVLALIGYFVADKALSIMTVQELPTYARFAPMVGAAVCVPIWKLYDNLRNLRNNEELSVRELREVAHRIEQNVRKMLFNILYLLLISIILTIVFFSVTAEEHVHFAIKAFSVFLFTAAGVLANTVYNMREIESFENYLAVRKSKKAHGKKLLEEMKGKH